jgi:hypothetical protein
VGAQRVLIGGTGEEPADPEATLTGWRRSLAAIPPGLAAVAEARPQRQCGSADRCKVRQASGNVGRVRAAVQASTAGVTAGTENTYADGGRRLEDSIDAFDISRRGVVLAVGEAVADDVDAVVDHRVEQCLEAGSRTCERGVIDHNVCVRRDTHHRRDIEERLDLCGTRGRSPVHRYPAQPSDLLGRPAHERQQVADVIDIEIAE